MHSKSEFPSYPKHVMIQTTSLCDSGCLMCPWPKVKSKFPQGHMTDELYHKIMAELAEHPEVEQIMPYLMNEPLVDPKIVERIRLARQARPNARIYIVTNGCRLTPKLSEELIESNMSWIVFSIHAIEPETYKTITGRSDFAKIREGVVDFIKRAQKANMHADYVVINITHMRPWVSDEEIERAKNFWREQGVNQIAYVSGYISRGGIIDVWGHGKPRHKRIAGCNTMWAYIMFHILYNGDVAPCCMDWNRRVKLGNLYHQTIEQVWHGKKMRDFYKIVHGNSPLFQDFICAQCEEAVVPKEATEEAKMTGKKEEELFARLKQLGEKTQSLRQKIGGL